MSIKWMLKALEAKVGNSGRKLVLIKLCDNANDDGACWPSYPYIAEHCEISERSAKAYIKDLVEQGFITRTQRKGVKGNSTNVYKMIFDRGEKSAPPLNTNTPRGENPAPLPSAESAPLDNTVPPRGAGFALGGENSAPPRGANPAPGISHSFEPVTKESKALSVPVESNLFTPIKTGFDKFPMSESWQPNESFADSCRFQGINLAEFSTDEQEDLINEFRSYWMTQSTMINQSGWEHKLVGSLKHTNRQKSGLANTSAPQAKRAAISAAIMDVGDISW